MNVKSLAGIALALQFGAAPILANELWQEVGAWSIMLSENGACFASRQLENGGEVQIGTEPAKLGGYVAIFNPAWTSIEEGDTGTVEFNFGNARFGGEAEARIVNGLPGGYAYFNNPAFVDAFASGQMVRVIGSSGTEFEFDLTGTHNAINGVFACQEANPTDAAADE